MTRSTGSVEVALPSNGKLSDPAKGRGPRARRPAAASDDDAAAAGGAGAAASPRKPRPADAPADGGLVSNGSLQELELEAFAAPAEAAAEEARLRAEREAADAAAAAAAGPASAAARAELDDDKFSKLEQLLNQSELYTKFLVEQMHAAEPAAAAAAAGGADAPEPAGGRKRRGKAAAAAPKRHRGDADAGVTGALCPGFVGSLREYQLGGVRWLISLYQNGLSGILADQMGLGKTVQTIAFLCHLRGKGVHGPFLVLGPLSTLSNWVAEFKRWAPDFPVLLYHGNRDERAELRSRHLRPGAAVGAAFPVVVTSYEIVLADFKALARFHWKYLVVDEGHRLKNMNCRLIRELRTLNVDNKLLLTGTPLQNNLTELWSLLNFLLPDVFTSLDNFESWFDFAADVGREGATAEIVARQQQSAVVTKLHSILKPFLLRRVKTDVETSLPGKMEVILYAPMTDKQREINSQLLAKTLNEEMAKRRGGGPSVASLNNMLMQMRKNANHPDLITAPFEGGPFFPSPEELVRDCGKMALLHRVLTRLEAGGHKTLIFSQMTSMLDILDSYLADRGIEACRIDGSVAWQDRQAAMARFNTEPECRVFLLSTRAGGLGINLTAADTCIIYDSDWNPHQDLQAMDRCHRIGQTRPVLVLRLATAHSVEGKMLRRASSKLLLERLVVKKGAFKELGGQADKKKASLGADELLDLLKEDVSLDDEPQSAEVDDAMLGRILDRSHLVAGKPLPYPEQGPGYEVVQQLEGSGLLQGVE